MFGELFLFVSFFIIIVFFFLWVTLRFAVSNDCALLVGGVGVDNAEICRKYFSYVYSMYLHIRIYQYV